MRALNLAHLENNVYPETASGMTVTFSGATLWTQGFFNDQVRNALKKVPDTPLDPVTDSPYIYSVSYNRQEYQLARGSEGGLLSMSSSIIPTAEADFSTLKVR